MKQLLFVAAVISGLIVSTTTALSQWQDGNLLLKECGRESPFIFGYIEGIIDAQGQSGLPLQYCLPSNVIAKQLKDAVCLHLSNAISTRHYIGAVLVPEALEKQWPCNK